MSTDAPQLAFPPGWTRAPQVLEEHVELLVEEHGVLDETHIAQVQAHVEAGCPPIGVGTESLKRIRQSHHRVAQLIASGCTNAEASRLTGMSMNRIAILKSDPTFCELLSHYSSEVKDEWMDFVKSARDLSLDIIEEMAHRIESAPEAIPFSALNEALKTLADRSGNGPVNKNVNLNLNSGMAERLNKARARVAALSAPSGSPPIDAEFSDVQ